jgi:regulator of protease activity HflC (stomatin/prohibitin superfamily)
MDLVSRGPIGARLIGFVVIVVAVLLLAFGSFYTVDQTERYVQTTLGEVQGVAGPGLHFKLPVVQQVRAYSVSQQDVDNISDEKGLSIYTNDNQEVFVHVRILYTVPEDQVLWIYENVTKDAATLRDRVWNTAVKAFKADMGKVNTTTIALQRDQINASAKKAVSDDVAGILHVRVDDVQILNIEYSPAFKAGVEAAALAKVAIERANQEKLQAEVDAAKKRIAAEGDASAVKAQADGAAYARLAEARAAAEATRLAGDAAAAAALAKGLAEAKAIEAQVAALRDNPDYVRLQIARQWNGALPTWNGGGPLPLLNLQGTDAPH